MLILIPSFPVKMRYQEFFISEIPKRLSNSFDEVLVLGKSVVHENDYNKSLFSPVDIAINFELEQTKEYMNLELKENDTLLHMDLSWTGLFHNILYHKRPNRNYVFAHGTSLNIGDYYEKDRVSKWLTELGNSKLYDKVFVATKYHADKLELDNTVIVGLPIPPWPTFKEEKIYDIISVARPNPQKVDFELEEIVSKNFGPIVRKECRSWEEYYKFLSSAKIVLFTGLEETFGYPVMETILNHSIPICPNRCSYTELLDDSYLYHNTKDLLALIDNYLSIYYLVPELKCLELCQNFYSNLITHMSS